MKKSPQTVGPEESLAHRNELLKQKMIESPMKTAIDCNGEAHMIVLGGVEIYSPKTKEFLGYVDLFPCFYCTNLVPIRGTRRAFSTARKLFPHGETCTRAVATSPILS
jgi:hypothetical protein